jgi:hypothetical protein
VRERAAWRWPVMWSLRSGFSPAKPVVGRNTKLPVASQEMTDPLPDVSAPTATTDSWGSGLGLRERGKVGARKGKGSGTQNRPRLRGGQESKKSRTGLDGWATTLC